MPFKDWGDYVLHSSSHSDVPVELAAPIIRHRHLSNKLTSGIVAAVALLRGGHAQRKLNVIRREFRSDHNRINGLAGAHCCELARLAANGNLLTSSPDAADGPLIPAQPKDYHRLLAVPPPGLMDRYRIGLRVCEFETAPSEWEFIYDILHEIWTPSTSSAAGIRRATSPPAKVVLHTVTAPKVQARPRQLFGLDKDQFVGMAIMDLSSCPGRKNPLAHVEAWKLAFSGDPSAHLLMKVRDSKRAQFVQKEPAEAIGEARNISVTEVIFGDRDMSAWQNTVMRLRLS